MATKKGKGTEHFDFTFDLGEAVILHCTAILRFGIIEDVVINHLTLTGKKFNPDRLVIDWEDEFLPMQESLKFHAQRLRNIAKEEKHNAQ